MTFLNPISENQQTLSTAPVGPRGDVSPEQEEVLGGNYSDYTLPTYMSFTGTDAVATLVIPPIGERYSSDNNGEVLTLGELQTISYSIHRENSPIRVLGRVNPKGFLKGSRTIAGSMIFTVFNEYAFYKIKKYRELLARRNGFYAPLADMLPPFDIILSFVNEYGNISKMKIFGVTIVDEGQTVSIDDLIIEQTYTFMARGIQPLVAFPREQEQSTTENDMQQINLGISTNIFGDQVTEDIVRLLYSKNLVEDTAS
jgi:hypothetical protein